MSVGAILEHTQHVIGARIRPAIADGIEIAAQVEAVLVASLVQIEERVGALAPTDDEEVGTRPAREDVGAGAAAE